MTNQARRLLTRFLRAVDSEGAGIFQWIIGAAFAVAGAQDLFIAHEAPLTLMGSMGWVSFKLWCWCAIGGAVQCLIGKALDGTKLVDAANFLQLVGDATLSLLLLAYTYATFHVEPLGSGGFGGYVGAALVVINAIMILRDIRRIRENLNRQPP